MATQIVGQRIGQKGANFNMVALAAAFWGLGGLKRLVEGKS